jgi:hypothetical protein
MPKYELRDESGTLKATLSQRLVSMIVLKSNGAWGPYRVKGGSSNNRKFTFADDYKLDHENVTGIGLCIWTNDYIVERY